MNLRPRAAIGLVGLAFAIEAASGIAPAGSMNVASATVIFVHPSDPTCGGNAPCFNSIQAAVDTAVAGDLVRLQGGNYAEKFVVGDKNNTPGATEADRIIVEGDPAAGAGGVVIQGTGSLCQEKFAIRIRDSKFVTVRGLTVSDAPGKAFFISGGAHSNDTVVIDRNRIFANRCGPAVQIANGNHKVIVSNNLIYNARADGVEVLGGSVPTDHYLVSNTITRSRQSGVALAGIAQATLINNAITQNNTTAVSADRGVRRRGSDMLDPTLVRLRNNYVCGNTNGELGGALLDAEDAGNRTPTGSEGTGVVASAGCDVVANLYEDADGADDTEGTADDDFKGADGSPLIDGGANPANLLTGFNGVIKRDYERKGRPRDGDGNGSKKYDVGAHEAPTAMSGGGPTILTTTSQPSGGVCGTITMSLMDEGVPNRRDPADPLTDPNAACTGIATPKACCSDVGSGHCDERTTVMCGTLSFGGGGAGVGNPGAEGASEGGSRTRYSLSCTSATDTACVISGNAGDVPNGLNCSSTGCGGVTPIESTAPVKVCALNTLGAPGASGTLNLVTGEISLSTTTNATVSILTNTSFDTTACPRCRASQALGTCSVTTELFCAADADCPETETCSVDNPPVFASGGLPGAGVCDDDAANAGATCFSFEPAGDTAGLTTDCTPSSTASAVIAIATTQTTAGTSVSDPAGHFCGDLGQGGNNDCTFGNSSCTAAGVPAVCCTGAGMGSCVGEPQVCCTGAGMGSCNNFNGCFGSANTTAKFVDIPAVCTGISIAGTAAGPLTAGVESPTTTYGTVSCIPAVAAAPVLSGLVNNNAGLPGPVVTSSKVTFKVE